MTLSDSKALILAMAAALAAAIATALGVIQITQGQPFWRAEAMASFLAASVWMFVGLKLSSRAAVSAIVLFLSGTAAAWFLTRGIVHSTSPYYGLAGFASAVIGGALVWLALSNGWRERRIGVAVPVVTLGLVTLTLLTRPNLGLTRTLSQADGDNREVHVTHLHDSLYVWTTSSLRADSTVRVELDPGSGPNEYRLREVTDATTRSAVCEQLTASTRSLVTTEVDRGSIPAFITRIGYRTGNCERGHVWALLP